MSSPVIIGTRIVAEGVEHKEQYELLKKLGVDYIQGFYFGKPVPANIFEPINSISLSA